MTSLGENLRKTYEIHKILRKSGLWMFSHPHGKIRSSQWLSSCCSKLLFTDQSTASHWYQIKLVTHSVCWDDRS